MFRDHEVGFLNLKVVKSSVFRGCLLKLEEEPGQIFQNLANVLKWECLLSTFRDNGKVIEWPHGQSAIFAREDWIRNKAKPLDNPSLPPATIPHFGMCQSMESLQQAIMIKDPNFHSRRSQSQCDWLSNVDALTLRLSSCFVRVGGGEYAWNFCPRA